MTSLACFFGFFPARVPASEPGAPLSLIPFPSQGGALWELLPSSREPSPGERRKGLCKMYFWLQQLQLNTVFLLPPFFFFFFLNMHTVLYLIFHLLYLGECFTYRSLILFNGCIVFYCTVISFIRSIV